MLKVQLKHPEIHASSRHLGIKSLIVSFPEGEPVTESVRNDLNTIKADVKLMSCDKLIINDCWDIKKYADVQLDRDSSASMEDLANVLIFAVCPYGWYCPGGDSNTKNVHDFPQN